MSQSLERRAKLAHRIPFEANVELGGPSGESFEARAIDLSGEGMHLRTAYLPEVGQPLSCTFDAGDGAVVSVGAEVVWRRDQGNGGEFGIQFTNIDDDQSRALERILDRKSLAMPLPPEGARVRLHIDGLGGPMRGVVKHPSERKLVVGSEIAFLQLGRDLQVEEKETGHKRPARIDRVDVEIDPSSKTPHLVISLVYTGDTKAQVAADLTDPTPQKPVEVEPDWLAHAKASLERVKPLMGTIGTRVRTFTKAMSERPERKGESAASIEPKLRTTAPPPNGALRAEGKRVFRNDEAEPAALSGAIARLPIGRKGLAAAAAMTGLLLVGSLALRSSDPAPEAAPVDVAAAAPLSAPGSEPGSEPGATPVAAGATASASANAASPSMPGVPAQAGATEPSAPAMVVAEAPHHEPSVFGNPDVRRGNVLRLRLDGPVDRILGASEPTGFTVVVPGRKSVEVASPLAEKDERIASIRVTNVASGAELSVVFKDGVPKYLVRGNGDELEIVLANRGEAVAAAEPKPKAKPAQEVVEAPAKAKLATATRGAHAAHAAHKKKARKHH
jgi:hypothetical protein